MSDSVDLYLAFGWVCPECGKAQFVNGVAAEMSDEDREEILDSLGFDSLSEGEFIGKPDAVTCDSCELEFFVNSPEEDFYDEDDDWDSTLDDDWEDEDAEDRPADDWDEWDDRGV